MDMTAYPPARISHPETGEVADPRVEALVNEVIGRVADKWT
ncbi:MAG: transcriptional regulator, partial [Pseudomonadota bacterium]|nr:transcriptional regulator [Pseudomonadota bacterium]